MKKKTLAWAIKSDNEYICVSWSKKEANELLREGERIIRVEIKEIVRKK